jgi:steroid delta-isomerase-like uncharacterized protein
MLSRGDFAVADEIIAPEFRANFAGMPPMNGRDAWVQVVQGFMSAFPDMRVDLHAALVDGNKCGIRYAWTGTHQAELMGIPATHRQVHVDGMGIFRLAHGKIVEEHVLEDMYGLLVQLGVAPPPGGPPPA